MSFKRIIHHTFIFCVLSCVGCTEEPTIGNVPGKYVGRYAGGVEEFYLAADGTYTQKFVKDKTVIYTNSGEWLIDGQRIRFTNFLTMNSWDIHQTAPPWKVDYMFCYWSDDGNRARISFSVNDLSQYIERLP